MWLTLSRRGERHALYSGRISYCPYIFINSLVGPDYIEMLVRHKTVEMVVRLDENTDASQRPTCVVCCPWRSL
jgi:hypothetical protein